MQAMDEDPLQIWDTLREKFERRFEAEAETAQFQLIDFAHREGESANSTINRFETAVKNCIDQGVAVDENLQKWMLLGRPAERLPSTELPDCSSGGPSKSGPAEGLDSRYR